MNDDGQYVAEFTGRFSDIPFEALSTEFQRRQEAGERPQCGSNKTTHGYNVPIHVFALFLILFLSTLACSFPLIVRRFPKLPVPNHALFISRHFGTGVLIATAFVHLFPTAYINLTDPCLPPFWTDVYPAMPGFIAMVSVMVVVGIEMFFATKGAGHSHAIDFQLLRGEEGQSGGSRSRHGSSRRSGSLNAFRQMPIRHEGGEGDVSLADQRSPYADSPATPNNSALNKPLPPEPDGEDSDLDLDELDPVADDMQPLNRNAQHTPDAGSDDDEYSPANGHANGRPKHTRSVSWADQQASSSHQHHRDVSPNSPSEQRLVLQCLMLEAGILFHSVFIGLALSVSTGSSFIVLLIAISFHQTFEGLALGSRIASISTFATTSTLRPWIMCLLYGVTTPIGQAIGLGVQGLYDPESQFGLLMVGIMNAISSGLLLYAGLVQLLAEDFLREESYIELRGKRRLQACASVVAGALLMALVGVWA